MSFSKSQIAELKEIIKSCMAEVLAEQQPVPQGSDIAENRLERVERQIKRCNIQKEIFRAEEENAEDLQKLEECLNSYECRPVVDDSEFQTMLDCYDFDNCVKSAEKLGYLYRGHPIKVCNLIGDALEMYEDLKDVANGSKQLGRLILNKLTFEDEATYYMAFSIESSDTSC